MTPSKGEAPDASRALPPSGGAPGADADRPAPLGGRAPRADARRNRARILEVAEGLFAAKGTSASTEEIARQAGVGVGTVFRHFPTKEALLEAIMVARLQLLVDEAERLSAGDDAGAAFSAFFTHAVERSTTKLALADALAGAGVDVERAVSRVGLELRGSLERLLAGAQRAGAVREDVGVTDVTGLLVGATRAAEHTGWDRESMARTLAVILDGLRPPRHP